MSNVGIFPDYYYSVEIDSAGIGLFLTEGLKALLAETSIYDDLFSQYRSGANCNIEQLKGFIVIGVNSDDSMLEHYRIIDIAAEQKVKLPSRFFRTDIQSYVGDWQLLKSKIDFYTGMLLLDTKKPISHTFFNNDLDIAIIPADFYSDNFEKDVVIHLMSLSETVFYIFSAYDDPDTDFLIFKYDSANSCFYMEGRGEYQNALASNSVQVILDKEWGAENGFLHALHKKITDFISIGVTRIDYLRINKLLLDIINIEKRFDFEFSLIRNNSTQLVCGFNYAAGGSKKKSEDDDLVAEVLALGEKKLLIDGVEYLFKIIKAGRNRCEFTIKNISGGVESLFSYFKKTTGKIISIQGVPVLNLEDMNIANDNSEIFGRAEIVEWV